LVALNLSYVNKAFAIKAESSSGSELLSVFMIGKHNAKGVN
jgi:hypothetical protein